MYVILDPEVLDCSDCLFNLEVTLTVDGFAPNTRTLQIEGKANDPF